MKVVIVSSGRSHLLNLAISLLNEGHDVYFYCLTPYLVIQKYGFPRERTKSFCYILSPLIFLLFKCRLPRKIRKILFFLSDLFIDNLAALFLKQCDVFIGAAQVANYSSKVAKKKYNALTICDSGTLHLKEQGILNKGNLSLKATLRRVYEFYNHSDYIVVAGNHVKESFLKHGVSPVKIFVNPYGVNLNQFYPTKIKSNHFDLIFVGTWSYIKGCDILEDVCLNKLKIKLLHVGGVGDLPLPKSEFFKHVGLVPQNELLKYYAQARVFILPSRSDGFGLVLAQAMAAGLPVVYSKMTGGPDLKNITNCSDKFSFEIADLSVESLCNVISEALASEEKYISKDKERNYLGNNLFLLGWENYGKRYINFLINHL